MSKSNYKTIKISPELHIELKLYCVKSNLKLNVWIEKQLQEKINQLKNEKNNFN